MQIVWSFLLEYHYHVIMVTGKESFSGNIPVIIYSLKYLTQAERKCVCPNTWVATKIYIYIYIYIYICGNSCIWAHDIRFWRLPILNTNDQWIIRVFNKLSKKVITYSLRKKFPYFQLFWSAFSRIRTEYGFHSECG